MKASKTVGICLPLCALAISGCAEVPIENIGGCYEIDGAPAFRIGNGYGVFVGDELIGRMQLAETDQGARYEISNGLIANRTEEGYTIAANPADAPGFGFVDTTFFGSVYFDIPTDAEAASELPATIEAYLNEEGEC